MRALMLYKERKNHQMKKIKSKVSYPCVSVGNPHPRWLLKAFQSPHANFVRFEAATRAAPSRRTAAFQVVQIADSTAFIQNESNLVGNSFYYDFNSCRPRRGIGGSVGVGCSMNPHLG